MLFFEDMTPGQTIGGPFFEVRREDLVAFATVWDPMPFHIDEAAGRAAFGGLTAPGNYILAVKQRLIHQLDDKHAVIASLGYDEIRFHSPSGPVTSCACMVNGWTVAHQTPS